MKNANTHVLTHTEEVCGVGVANLIAVALPWALALVLYTGTLLNSLLNWTGLFLVVPLNFVLPCWLYIQSRAKENPLGKKTTSDGNLAPSLLTSTDQVNSYLTASVLTAFDEPGQLSGSRGETPDPDLRSVPIEESLLVFDSCSTKPEATSLGPVFWPARSSIQSTVDTFSDQPRYCGVNLHTHGVPLAKAIIVMSVALNIAAIVYAA